MQRHERVSKLRVEDRRERSRDQNVFYHRDLTAFDDIGRPEDQNWIVMEE